MNAAALTQGYPDGLHTDIPEPEYHALDRFSQSGAKRILRSPAHYLTERTATPAMQQGSLIDVALTSPERLASEYHTVADDLRMDARTKAYQAEAEAAAGKTIVKQRDMDAALRIRDAVHDHPTARELLDGAEAQLSMLWTEQIEPDVAVPCKGRADWVNSRLRVLIDLKSIDDARKFPRRAGDMGYHIQEAAYRRGWRECGDWQPAAFLFIVVERDLPHGIRVFDFPANACNEGERLWLLAVERYAHCRETHTWPCYPHGIETVELPPWAYRGEDE